MPPAINCSNNFSHTLFAIFTGKSCIDRSLQNSLYVWGRSHPFPSMDSDSLLITLCSRVCGFAKNTYIYFVSCCEAGQLNSMHSHHCFCHTSNRVPTRILPKQWCFSNYLSMHWYAGKLYTFASCRNGFCICFMLRIWSASIFQIYQIIILVLVDSDYSFHTHYKTTLYFGYSCWLVGCGNNSLFFTQNITALWINFHKAAFISAVLSVTRSIVRILWFVFLW